MEKSTATVPTWINAALFEGLLRDLSDNFKSIEQFKASPALGPGENYGSLMIAIEIEVQLLDGSREQVSFMMKTKLQDGVLSEIDKEQDFFGIENNMYGNILRDFEHLHENAGVPVKLMARSYKLSTHHDYILLDNLTKRGFRNADRIAGLDKLHIECALEKLAQWHAASAVHCQKEGTFGREMSFDSIAHVYGKIVDAMQTEFLQVLNQLEGQQEFREKFENCRTRIMVNCVAVSRSEAHEFNVLTHGDLWTNNMMFQYDNSGNLLDVIFVDFSVPIYSTPVRDIINLLLSSGQSDVKIRHFDYFLRFYHKHLIENLQKLSYEQKMPTLRDLHISCLKLGSWALIGSMTWMAATILDASEQSNFDNFISDTEAGRSFRHKMFSNARYLEHARIVFPWLLNRGALDF